jgi:cellulose synthase/poly-beta-1,6-N-acetylglucosamine synthase-like glycosyltransferase
VTAAAPGPQPGVAPTDQEPRSRVSRGRATPLRDPLLSVIMPVYNERNTVEEIIDRVLAVPVRIELIAVDDASSDGSRDILQQLALERGFRLLLQEKNQGKGAAVRRGIRQPPATSSWCRTPISSTAPRSIPISSTSS